MRILLLEDDPILSEILEEHLLERWDTIKRYPSLKKQKMPHSRSGLSSLWAPLKTTCLGALIHDRNPGTIAISPIWIKHLVRVFRGVLVQHRKTEILEISCQIDDL